MDNKKMELSQCRMNHAQETLQVAAEKFVYLLPGCLVSVIPTATCVNPLFGKSKTQPGQ